jgi:hypothetical protein
MGEGSQERWSQREPATMAALHRVNLLYRLPTPIEPVNSTTLQWRYGTGVVRRGVGGADAAPRSPAASQSPRSARGASKEACGDECQKVGDRRHGRRRSSAVGHCDGLGLRIRAGREPVDGQRQARSGSADDGDQLHQARPGDGAVERPGRAGPGHPPGAELGHHRRCLHRPG